MLQEWKRPDTLREIPDAPRLAPSETDLKTVARLVAAAKNPFIAVQAAGRDPDEFHDLGADPAYAAERARLHEAMFAWVRRHHARTTISDAAIAQRHGGEVARGILIGYWDETEVEAAKRST